jgi:glyoxylase-like metal-dependent hydrolase (beta-lactamase superfamily II)
MREVADGVWQLAGFPRYLFNVYLAGGVLFDAATRWARRRILRQVRGRPPGLVALTHCHPDHRGSARAVCEALGVPLACHEADAPAVEGRAPMVPRNFEIWLEQRLLAGPPCPVGRPLRDGDEVGGFRVVHTPGHTPGHVVYFRDRDRVAIAGDVLNNMNIFTGIFTGRHGLREPPSFLSADPAQNRRSAALLGSLRPRVVCFGHGPPLHDPGLLERFLAGIG